MLFRSGILDGHKGGRPAKLTAEMLEGGNKLACGHPMTLREIAAGIRKAHPEAPEFSLDRLAVGLKARGLSFKRTRLSDSPEESLMQVHSVDSTSRE
mgnify:FL=1